MKPSCLIAAGLLLSLTPLSVHALATVGSVPVLVGNVADLDACMTVGEVSGLDRQGDGFLAVRTGPGEGHAMVDKLTTGRQVYHCDERGTWMGIVCTNDPGEVDCGVASPRDAPEPYTGPCLSGWVHARWVKAIAG
jgi:hypothetical protein